jgi:hypothetical protein
MPPREWMMVQSQGRTTVGWIPRDVAERIGVDCSALDKRVKNFAGREVQGTVWIRSDHAAAIRNHREFLVGSDPRAAHDSASDAT